MRIGLLIYGSLDTVSGGYLYDRKLVSTLERAGNTVEIITLPWRSYPRHLADNFSSRYIRQITGLGLDVLIQDELNHPSLFLLNARLRRQRPMVVVSLVHHLRISEQHAPALMPIYRLVERTYLSSVDAFIFNSRTTQAAVEALAGGARPSIVAYPAGDRLDLEIAPDAIRRRAHAQGPLRLLFLGSVIPRKGLHTLLHALGDLEYGSWELAVAGSLASDRAYARRMISLVRRKGWENSVRFLDVLADENLREVLMESHLIVLPSQYEGFGIAYLEGMGAGLPAIGSTGGAAHEVIGQGETGFLVEPGDAGELSAHLRRFLLDRIFLAEMGIRARQRYETHPTWEQSMDGIHTFLREMVFPGERFF